MKTVKICHITLVVIFYACVVCVGTSCIFSFDGNYLHYLQHIESADGKYNYCLFRSETVFREPSYFVLKVEKEINLKKFNKLRKGTKREDWYWINDRQLLSNLEDSGLLIENPNIKVINSRYLVFSRGGYYFGLYDLKLDSAIVNVVNIFWEWERLPDEDNMLKKNLSRKELKREYEKWVKENLHERIEKHIAESPCSP